MLPRWLNYIYVCTEAEILQSYSMHVINWWLGRVQIQEQMSK